MFKIKVKGLFVINGKEYIQNTWISKYNGKYYGSSFGHWYELISNFYVDNERIFVFG